MPINPRFVFLVRDPRLNSGVSPAQLLMQYFLWGQGETRQQADQATGLVSYAARNTFLKDAVCQVTWLFHLSRYFEKPLKCFVLKVVCWSRL